MDREETKITSIIKPQETDQKKTNLSNRNLYTDAERQLFNASLAVHQFLKEARKDEANSVQARKKCRKLLKAGKILDARGVAKEALEASGRAYACSAVAKRIDWFVNKEDLCVQLCSFLGSCRICLLKADATKGSSIMNHLVLDERIKGSMKMVSSQKSKYH
ncbi:uncharacterized protein [Halyomorpha halys]|uniref:uncharacterized protein isoform X2 n=1 Tax=Halyomorpha halys TaxID=286706 RepID=UPI0006D51F4F|nr:uncharacterized protein LOC106688888 isoform X2 [Halyomorpha halys]